MAINKVQSISTRTWSALSPAQERAVILLASGKSGRDTAKAIGVTPESISHWRHLHAFRTALDELRRETMESAADALRDLAITAVATVKECMNSRDANVRLRAATTVLKMVAEEPLYILPQEPVNQYSPSGERYSTVEEAREQARRMKAMGLKLMEYIEARRAAEGTVPPAGENMDLQG